MSISNNVFIVTALTNVFEAAVCVLQEQSQINLSDVKSQKLPVYLREHARTFEIMADEALKKTAVEKVIATLPSVSDEPACISTVVRAFMQAQSEIRQPDPHAARESALHYLKLLTVSVGNGPCLEKTPASYKHPEIKR